MHIIKDLPEFCTEKAMRMAYRTRFWHCCFSVRPSEASDYASSWPRNEVWSRGIPTMLISMPDVRFENHGRLGLLSWLTSIYVHQSCIDQY